MKPWILLPIFLTLALTSAMGQESENPLIAAVDRAAEAIENKVIQWRRHIHEYPELGNREHETAKYVAEHLKSLGIEVREHVGYTGIVAVLRGGKPGPVVALRADMDGLPVTERVDLPFASKVRTTYNGNEVGVMHACGHDNHVAILMGTAEVLAQLKKDLPGTVVFIFQPAEEGAPEGEEGGADLMIREGALENPKPDAIFGLHVTQGWTAGEIAYRKGGAMASSDGFKIIVKGRQTHAAMPWGGVDPIVVASQIILGLQTIVSRQIETTAAPAIISVGMIHGGVRGNIIPDEVVLTGTIRAFLPDMRNEIHERVRRTAAGIAESAGASAEVIIPGGYPVTVNDGPLSDAMRPTLQRVAGPGRLYEAPRVTGAEDFSYFQRVVPGLFFFLGVRPPDVPRDKAVSNHSPLFYADESALLTGVRAMAGLAVDYLQNQ